VLVAANLKAN